MALSRTRKPKLTPEEEAARQGFIEACYWQRCCHKCGSTKPWDPHHVVEQKKLKAIHRKDILWDPRNAMRLCVDCHANHTGASDKVPLALLTAANYEFAFEALGGSAFYYLPAHYDGDDPRLSDYLTRWEKTNGNAPGGGIAAT